MIIENSKIYDVTDVENIFFRPTFCGKSADEMGIRVLYNMPTPTKVPFFRHNNDILREFSSGWQGERKSYFEEQEIPMYKLKAESAYSAERYFSTIYEMLVTLNGDAMGDLSGSDLEKAETELFRRSLAESIYATTWFGDIDGEVSDYVGFQGFIRDIIDLKSLYGDNIPLKLHLNPQEMGVEEILRLSWTNADDDLRSLASDGNLAYFVTSDIYDAYQFYLDANGTSNAYLDTVNGRPTLSYHGIQLIEIPSKRYDVRRGGSFCILTDRRNLILALNTADSPEKEIRMWYNPDEMENRQRVVFLAGTAIADSNLISAYIYDKGVNL